jgi:hypothetical protein
MPIGDKMTVSDPQPVRYPGSSRRKPLSKRVRVVTDGERWASSGTSQTLSNASAAALRTEQRHCAAYPKSASVWDRSFAYQAHRSERHARCNRARGVVGAHLLRVAQQDRCQVCARWSDKGHRRRYSEALEAYAHRRQIFGPLFRRKLDRTGPRLDLGTTSTCR